MGLVSKNAGLVVKSKGFRAIYDREMRAREEILDKAPPQPWDDPKLKFKWQRVKAFLEDLTITSGSEAGKRLELRGFQIDFIKAVYREEHDGVRPVRTAILSIARKNGKSALAAGLALCHLVGPEAESRGEVYSCANDRAQAAKIFEEMVAMQNEHNYLRARCNVILFHRTITDILTGSKFVALSREVKTKYGLSPSFVVVDEYGQAHDDLLYRAMDSAMGARTNPLLMVISTQAADDAAPFSRLIDYGLKIKNKQMKDPSFHLSLHAAHPKDNPWRESTWKKANPALGEPGKDGFRSLEDIARQAAQAQRMPGQENSFRNLILNQRVHTHTPFLNLNAWKACGGVSKIPAGSKVYAALDLGWTRDMSALVMVCQDMEGIFHVQPFYWLPGDIAERETEDRAPYGEWVAKGLLNAIGQATDPEVIARKIAELNGHYRIQTLAFDRWRMNDLKRELDAIGCTVKLVPHGQGFREMSPAVDILERLITQRRVRHGNHAILTWNSANAVVTRDPAGGRKLDKAKSHGRIDGLVALAMSFSVALVKDAPPKFDAAALIG